MKLFEREFSKFSTGRKSIAYNKEFKKLLTRLQSVSEVESRKEKDIYTAFDKAWDFYSFNAQYPTLKIKYTKVFLDRFLILDRMTAYHVGASLKDAGKKCFGINLIQDAGIIKDILQRLELETE